MIRNIAIKLKGYTRDYLRVVIIFLVFVATVSGCGPSSKEPLNQMEFKPLAVSTADDLGLAEGFSSQVLVSSMDSLGENTRFGYDVSGLVYAGEEEGEGVLWVNHELIKPMFTSGYYGDIARLRKHIVIEQNAVGATAMKVFRDGDGWAYKIADGVHKRLSASDPVPIDQTVQEKDQARGTTANKLAAYTSMNTFLSAEAGYEQYYGEYIFGTSQYQPGIFRWASFFYDDPRLYGWVVETDLSTGASRKLTDLGRLRRNGLVLQEKGNDLIAYFTERGSNGRLFRYVTRKTDWPTGGTLYVANLEANQWMPLTLEHRRLGLLFEDPLQLRMNLREAARAVEATTFDNPGGLAISPVNGDLYMTTANDLETQNYHGSVMVFTNSGDEFTWDTLIEGGEESGISCPAELQFDQQGNLWLASAIPSQLMNKGVYTAFGNNALFVLPNGGSAPVRIANAPVDARFGGLSFADGDQFLFMSVQQPGARSTSIWDFDFTSHWPGGGKSMPKSSVVVLSRQ